MIAGADERDIFTPLLSTPDLLFPPFNPSAPLSSIKVGVYKPWSSDCDKEVYLSFQKGVECLEKYGAQVVEVGIPLLEQLRIAHVITITSEMNSAMYPRNDKRHLHGSSVRLSLNLTRNFTAAEYVQSQRVRSASALAFKKVFETVDVLVTPTTGDAALPYPPDTTAGDSDSHKISSYTRFMFPANMIGFPAISVPCGYTNEGLPIGFQVMSDIEEETLCMLVGMQIEKEFERMKPKILTKVL